MTDLYTFFLLISVAVVLVGSIAAVVSSVSRGAYENGYKILKENIVTQQKTIDLLRGDLKTMQLQVEDLTSRFRRQIEDLRDRVEILEDYITDADMPIPKDREHAAEIIARKRQTQAVVRELAKGIEPVNDMGDHNGRIARSRLLREQSRANREAGNHPEDNHRTL